jgi:hypothetical protein
MTDNDEYFRIRQEKQQVQYDQLKIAYRPLLPNDIYKTYYSEIFKYLKNINKRLMFNLFFNYLKIHSQSNQ